MTPEQRLEICKSCPLMTEEKLGPICDNKKYMDPTTGKVSKVYHAGGIKGCACRLNFKTKIPYAHCVANKG